MVEGREERKEELRTLQSFKVMKTTNSISGDCEGGHSNEMSPLSRVPVGEIRDFKLSRHHFHPHTSNDLVIPTSTRPNPLYDAKFTDKGLEHP